MCSLQKGPGGTDGKLGSGTPGSLSAPETGLLLLPAGAASLVVRGVGGRALCGGHLGSVPAGHVEAARHCGVGWSSAKMHEDGLSHLVPRGNHYPKSHVSRVLRG